MAVKMLRTGLQKYVHPLSTDMLTESGDDYNYSLAPNVL